MVYRHRVSARFAIGLCAAALLAAAPAGAEAGKPRGPWATVNVCDTPANPDTIGIRGSMPGTGAAGDSLFMRFQVQYLDPVKVRWRYVGAAADSGFVSVGTGKARRRQGGRDFTIRPGTVGYVLRGIVTFEWRRGPTVTHSARRFTTAGHPGTPGADPAGFTAATCAVS